MRRRPRKRLRTEKSPVTPNIVASTIGELRLVDVATLAGWRPLLGFAERPPLCRFTLLVAAYTVGELRLG